MLWLRSLFWTKCCGCWINGAFGRTFGDVMILLLIAFVLNILLVRFQKYTKLRSVFTTGNVQVQQAATAFDFIVLFSSIQAGYKY